MIFRTPIDPIITSFKLKHALRYLTLGSCFSEVMGAQLLTLKQPVLNNPFGTLFSPVAIAHALNTCISPQPADTSLFIHTPSGWQSYGHHSVFTEVSSGALSARIEQVGHNAATWFAATDVLLLTLGTAFVYKHLGTQTYVANCHKQPARLFQKVLLTVTETENILTEALVRALTLKPNLRVILTVSPVRHTRDTLTANNLSKSTLRIVCEALTQRFEQVVYFPSYEIMLDDLRDYRFYEADMIHPNAVAQRYIFERFQEAYFDTSFIEFAEKWNSIRTRLLHRPAQVGTQAHQQFLKNLLKDLHAMPDWVDTSAEVAQVNAALIDPPM